MPEEPLIAKISMFAGNFAPRGWAFCDGQLLQISQNTALFAILGTTFGGDGRTTLGLPDMRSRAPMHPGNGPGLTPRSLGQRAGSATETLTVAQLPSHTHQWKGVSAQSDLDVPAAATSTAAVQGGPFLADLYHPSAGLVDMAADHLGETGADGDHDNEQPHTVINFIIALQGFFPSRN